MTFKSLIITATLLVVSQFSFALTLDEARSKGELGENASGYLELTPRGESEAKVLMESVNAQRKIRYAEIAAKQKLELKNIEKIAGEKITEKLNPGEFYKDANGNWNKK